jgi:capsular exopolysaccharide synthesis family protein
MDSTILSVADIEGMGLQHLASLPELTARQLRARGGSILPWDYVVERPMSIFSEALRNVRSALTLGGARAAPKVVVITSSVPDEGKSIAAVSLARVMALSGDRVLLMDCDLRKNALQDLLKKKVDHGLVEVLAGQAKLADVLVRDEATGLDVLPLSESLFTAKDVFGGPGMQALIDGLRPSYDVIVIDAPPVLAVTDARTLAALADAVILSVRWRSTPREVVDAALVKLENETDRVIGAVLTRVDPNLRANDVGYYHHYAKGYYADS